MRSVSITITALAALLVAATTVFAQQSDAPVTAYRMGPGMMGSGLAGPGVIGGAMGPGMMGSLSRYPDGYIAFLKAELKITPAQEGAWSKLTDALRIQASAAQSTWPRGMMTGQGTMGPAMMSGASQSWQPPALPDALDSQIASEEQRLAALKAVRDAAKPLYAKLTGEQKAKADRLLGCPNCY